MDGPSHYRESEQCVKDAQNLRDVARTNVLLEAQVHATLALVAARLPIPRDHRAWADVLNGEPG